MRASTKLTLAACAAVIVLGGVAASNASAASPYGPTGLGSNLHRRFVIKQSIKRTRAGQSVSDRRILWQSRPYTNRLIRVNRNRWRGW